MNFSAQYYNQQALGLGMDFLEEIEKSLQLIKENPERWPYYEENIHKYNIRRFPFSIFYVFEKKLDKIIIIAVAHQKRKPNYWKQRI
ncbi:MAG: type II toxin-antitoxin system RelE/ParE family toxin [Candidatus Lokiarchaeota archaeon]|nr:type II toxin-antitoxin system RelE/ParE family toxin [Candidatus Lokiarchaeota archaeon]